MTRTTLIAVVLVLLSTLSWAAESSTDQPQPQAVPFDIVFIPALPLRQTQPHPQRPGRRGSKPNLAATPASGKPFR